jgi:hypothetical protein
VVYEAAKYLEDIESPSYVDILLENFGKRWERRVFDQTSSRFLWHFEGRIIASYHPKTKVLAFLIRRKLPPREVLFANNTWYS